MSNLFKRTIGLILSLCVMCSAVSVFAVEGNAGDKSHPFTDVSGDQWYNEYVQNVWEKGIFNGASETAFDAGASLTRGMFVTILGRLAGAEVSGYRESNFSDVDINEWYGAYVAWASANGIANGAAEDKFEPDSPVTREQIAAIVHRFLEKYEYETAAGGELKCTDSAEISEYAKEAVSVCESAGIMQGDNEGAFKPKNHITRAEAAAVITRLEKYMSGSPEDSSNAGYSYPTFNELDQQKIVTAIQAMSNSEFEGASLAKWIYYVAFSTSFTLNGTPDEILDNIFVGVKSADANSEEENAVSAEEVPAEAVSLMEMIVPSLYSGYSEDEKLKEYFKGSPKEELSENDLIIGDIVIIHKDSANSESAKMYMYNGSELVEMLEKGVIKTEAGSILANLTSSDRYVVLRPSMVMKNVNYSTPIKDTELTPYQEALVTTAESYILRGDRVQYADTNMCPYGENRWQKGLKAPEDYTSDEWGYTNCAAFTHDVYLYGLGYEIDMFTTRVLIDAPEEIRPFYYEITGNEIEEEKAAVEKQFKDELEVGDIIVYRRESGGHAMLYAGNDTIIHSTGSTYLYAEQRERYEASIRYMSLEDLFTEGLSRDVFGGEIIKLAIVRPLNTFTGEIPENTQNRVKNMKGIFAEKLSSHNSGKSVNPGDEISFTFTVLNTNNYDAEFEITDTVPENTTYVSGAENTEGVNLSWRVSVPAGEEKKVSYTVKVNEDTALGSYIKSADSTVGGVITKCADIYVENTLTADEQEKITKETVNAKASNLSGVELANEIYKNAIGIANVLPGKTYDDLTSGVFVLDEEYVEPTGDYYKLGRYLLNETGTYSEMVVPALYGGRGLWIEEQNIRTRLLRENKLMAGDIVVAKNINEDNLFIYTNDGLFDLNKKEYAEDAKAYLASLMGLDNFDYYFAVLRPSMAIE